MMRVFWIQSSQVLVKRLHLSLLRHMLAQIRLDEAGSLAMPDATIHTIGEVLEFRGEVLYRVSLPNGKEIHAHLSKELKEGNAQFEVGQRLLLEMTPYDFDGARILGLAAMQPD